MNKENSSEQVPAETSNVLKRKKQILITLFTHPTFQRWLDLTFLSCCSIFIIRIFQHQIVTVLNAWVFFTSLVVPFWHYSSIVLSAFLLTIVLIRCGALNPSFSLHVFVRYPPVWMCGIFSLPICLYLVRESFNPIPLHYFQSLGILASFFVAFSIGVGLCFISLFYTNQSKAIVTTGNGLRGPQNAQQRKLKLEEQDFLRWIFEERPITTPEQDRYDTLTSARRISKILLSDQAKNIGLTGAFGTGKSSLLNLVSKNLTQSNGIHRKSCDQSLFSGQIAVCRLDAWGRQAGTIARQFLEVALDEVKKHVDCLSIISLPQNYLTAIGATKHVFGSVMATLLNSTAEPLAQLKRLDHILIAANIRLVILVEDSDRNINQQILDEELASLLDRLSSLRNVAFVLAISTERNWSHILIRICDYQEAVA